MSYRSNVLVYFNTDKLAGVVPDLQFRDSTDHCAAMASRFHLIANVSYCMEHCPLDITSARGVANSAFADADI